MKQKKKNIVPIFLLILILISFILFTNSIIQIYNWNQDSKKINQLTQEIEEKVTIDEIIEDDNSHDVSIIEPNPEIYEQKTNPYWDYIKMNLIEVDLTELKKINPDTIGWIQVEGTNINYPFVQTTDNSYYLKHAFDKSFNYAGWVFLDYRNQLENLHQNTILYAHGRVDTTMFGSLKNLLKSDWYEKKENHIIKLSTNYQNTLWQIFSVYHIPTTSDYLQIDFNQEIDFQNFIEMLQKRSVYSFDTSVSTSDKILTLSTCYNNQEKMVMHAKLIKYANK